MVALGLQLLVHGVVLVGLDGAAQELVTEEALDFGEAGTWCGQGWGIWFHLLAKRKQ